MAMSIDFLTIKKNFIMKKSILLFAAFLLFSSHDMFLKMGTYFLNPNTPATIKLFNGTFEESENVIARSRIRDVSLVSNGVRTNPDTTQWSESGNVTIFNFRTGEPGTWVAGLSTHANSIELKAAEFNEYLEHDGVLDMLEWRKENNALGKDANEKYSKHVKAIFQVGNQKTDDWKTVLGYPIEFVPQRNPYDLKAGETLPVILLWQGQPLANQLIYAGSDGVHGHSHEHDAAHSHDHEQDNGHSHGSTQLRTDANGLVSLKIENDGQWYLRTIHMAQLQGQELTHESNWATLTFEVKQDGISSGLHTHADGTTHSHDEEEVHSQGLPMWGYLLAGAALLLGLFWFLKSRKNSSGHRR